MAGFVCLGDIDPEADLLARVSRRSFQFVEGSQLPLGFQTIALERQV